MLVRVEGLKVVIRPPPMAARAFPSTAKRAGESSLDAAGEKGCQFAKPPSLEN